jgi:hypothetical protein
LHYDKRKRKRKGENNQNENGKNIDTPEFFFANEMQFEFLRRAIRGDSVA